MLAERLIGSIQSDSCDKYLLDCQNPNETCQRHTDHSCHQLFQQHTMCMPHCLLYQQTFHQGRTNTTAALFRWQKCQSRNLDIRSCLKCFGIFLEHMGGNFLGLRQADAILLDTGHISKSLSHCQHETLRSSTCHTCCLLCQHCKTGRSHFLDPTVSQRCSSYTTFAP